MAWSRWFLAICVATPGCLLDLEREPACGDGYVDAEVGEQCEPSDEGSFLSACLTQFGIDAGADCDPATCRLDLSGCLPACGNGVLDPAEECDPNATETIAKLGAEGVPCKGIDPPGAALAYAGGLIRRCLDDCTYDRRDCHFCGDGRLQVEDEICDEGLADIAAIDDTCYALCVGPQTDPRPTRVVCNLECTEACTALDSPGSEELGCCLPSGEAVQPDGGVPCCSRPSPTDTHCPLPLGGP